MAASGRPCYDRPPVRCARGLEAYARRAHTRSLLEDTTTTPSTPRTSCASSGASRARVLLRRAAGSYTHLITSTTTACRLKIIPPFFMYFSRDTTSTTCSLSILWYYTSRGVLGAVWRSTTLNPPGPNAGLRQNAACALESPLATCRRTETKRGMA